MRYIIYFAFLITLGECSLAGVGEDPRSIGSLMLHPLPVPETIAKTYYSYKDTVLFYLYTKDSPSAAKQIRINDTASVKSSNFDFSKKTVFIIHGYMANVNFKITQSIKNGLLKFDDVNAIGVDWSYFTETLYYAWAVSEVPGVGRFVGRMAGFLISLGVSASDVHLVGHSLGAHVSGFAGKQMQRYGHVPGRISGLDPALPLFSGYGPTDRLASADAQFVDCIHTCVGLLGFDAPICQADFYPNGGNDVQPGCVGLDFGLCSHSRAYEYFASSINASNKFYAKAYCKGRGCSESGAQMGYFASPRHLGEFHLKTTGSHPFSRNVTVSSA